MESRCRWTLNLIVFNPRKTQNKQRQMNGNWTDGCWKSIKECGNRRPSPWCVYSSWWRWRILPECKIRTHPPTAPISKFPSRLFFVVSMRDGMADLGENTLCSAHNLEPFVSGLCAIFACSFLCPLGANYISAERVNVWNVLCIWVSVVCRFM
jgi:hypothetical protein